MTDEMEEYLFELLVEDLADAIKSYGAPTILMRLRKHWPVEWDELVSAAHSKPKQKVAAILQAPVQVTGCYDGCFYYTDSCFRSDCKKK